MPRTEPPAPVSGEALGPLRFTFAIVADSHMNPQDDRTSSPWVTNKLANDRTRAVIHALNGHRPAFVVHLGDMIHPVPALPSYGPAAERFHQLMAGLEAPLRVVSGNHDVGDKPVAWMPAGNVSEENLALYRRHFGADWYSFAHEDCHFAVINAQIVNSNFPAEAEQRDWLEADLAAARGKRLFLCTHYPPYVADPHESGHYDNLDEPGRAWLLGVLARHRVEALFAGHVHNWFYNRAGATECYILPSIAFVRHDYTEMFRVGPGPEEGRDDAPKLGYFLVDVHERGHVAHMIRTGGATLAEGEAPPPPVQRLPPRHSKAGRPAPLGVDLRHPWAERVDIPYSGALDEFARKKVRNDYALLALWEMGIRRLRVPLQDLLEPETRARMTELHALGHAFTVFHYGLPAGTVRARLRAHAALAERLEIVLRWDEAERLLPALRELALVCGRPLFLSKLRTSADAERDGSRFHHFINHGFRPDERETLAAFLAQLPSGARDWLGGFVFRVARGDAPWADLPAIAALAAELGVQPLVQVRLAGDNPAEPMFDGPANTGRVAEALAAAWVQPGVSTFLDTFVDLDRGYFPRTGLIDRRYNPRDAGRVMAHLPAALEHAGGPWRPGPAEAVAGARVCVLEREQNRSDANHAAPPALLILPGPNARPEALPWPGAPDKATDAASAAGRGTLYELVPGTWRPLPWRRQGKVLQPQEPLPGTGPLLFVPGA